MSSGGTWMSRAKMGKGAEVKVAFEALRGRQGGKGIFGIEDAAEEVARQAKLAAMAERIAAYDRGYEGGRRKCPRCGQWQKYKGDTVREVVFDCGSLKLARAYYVCGACGQSSYPLYSRCMSLYSSYRGGNGCGVPASTASPVLTDSLAK
jgi:hypothetical protein